MVKGLNPENFIKEFEPGSNPFEITIVRLMNPRAVDIRTMDKPILVKLLSRIKMRSFSDAHRKAFETLVRAIDVKEMFCGIFTPDVSEIYFDGDVMIVDLTSYLKPGMETKIAKLFQVANESPRVHEERIPNKEVTDRAITTRFLQNVGNGLAIGEALKLAIQQQERGEEVTPRPQSLVAQPPPLPPPPPPQPMTRGQKASPPVVTIYTDPAESAIEDKIAAMERLQKEKEVAEVQEDAAGKGKKPKKAVRRVKKKGVKDPEPEGTVAMTEGQPGTTAVIPPVEPQAPAAPQIAEGAEPQTNLTPVMDDSTLVTTTTQETSTVMQPEVGPEPLANVEGPSDMKVEEKSVDMTKDHPSLIRPPPSITKEPEIDIMVGKPTETTSSGRVGVGDLLSKLKGVSLDAPKELAKEAPKVSDQLMAAPPPPPPPEPPKKEPKSKAWEKHQDKESEPVVGKAWEKKGETEPAPPVDKQGVRIPPTPPVSDEPIKSVDVTPSDKPKAKSGESGLDDLMKKLRAHK